MLVDCAVQQELTCARCGDNVSTYEHATFRCRCKPCFDHHMDELSERLLERLNTAVWRASRRGLPIDRVMEVLDCVKVTAFVQRG